MTETLLHYVSLTTSTTGRFVGAAHVWADGQDDAIVAAVQLAPDAAGPFHAVEFTVPSRIHVPDQFIGRLLSAEDLAAFDRAAGGTGETSTLSVVDGVDLAVTDERHDDHNLPAAPISADSAPGAPPPDAAAGRDPGLTHPDPDQRPLVTDPEPDKAWAASLAAAEARMAEMWDEWGKWAHAVWLIRGATEDDELSAADKVAAIKTVVAAAPAAEPPVLKRLRRYFSHQALPFGSPGDLVRTVSHRPELTIDAAQALVVIAVTLDELLAGSEADG